MKRVSNSLRRLARSLFDDPGRQQQLIDAVLEPRSFPRAVLWLTERPDELPFDVERPTAWQPEFVDRVSVGQRPGSTALHEAGAYYCLEASSVFAAVPMLLVSPEPGLVIDACASPGGKSVFCHRALRPRRLLCNEVIRKRTAALISNLRRCRVHPAMVLSRDTARLADRLSESAELVVVDAPCSGQSLVARGKRSPGCFHRSTINLNSNRQKRILANSAKLVAPGGHLAYMTCTYSSQENERVVGWLCERFPQFVPQEVPILTEHRSHLAEFPCYRLWPHRGIGAGAFTAVLLNRSERARQTPNLGALRPVYSAPGESPGAR